MDDLEWQMLMDGYLGGSQIYQTLYYLMRPHYLKALEKRGFEGHTEQRLVEHIAIGYLAGWESLQTNNPDGQPSLFYKILSETETAVEGSRNRWLEAAGFFWGHTKRTLKKQEQELDGRRRGAI